MSLRILVTGGAGFIGSHTVERLIGAGHAVTVLDDFSTGKRDNLRAVADRVGVVQGDVRDLAVVRAAADGVDVIYHAAAVVSVQRSIEAPLETHDINVRGTLTALEAARLCRVRRFVLASSAAVYGDGDGDGDCKGPLAPASPYGVEKAAAESYVRLYTALHDVEGVVLRYFNVFGPRQDAASPYAGVLALFAARLAEGRVMTIHGDGEQSRDFVDVADVASANVLAMTVDRAAGHTFDVGRGVETTLNDIVQTLSSLTGLVPQVVHGPARSGDIRRSVATIGRAREVLGYAPSVSVRDGLARLLAAETRLSTDPR